MKLETLDYLMDALDEGQQRIGDAVRNSRELVERQLRPIVDGVNDYFPSNPGSSDTYQSDAWRTALHIERPVVSRYTNSFLERLTRD